MSLFTATGAAGAGAAKHVVQERRHDRATTRRPLMVVTTARVQTRQDVKWKNACAHCCFVFEVALVECKPPNVLSTSVSCDCCSIRRQIFHGLIVILCFCNAYPIYVSNEPVHGNWGGWGGCSKACGSGTKTRSCNNPTRVGFRGWRHLTETHRRKVQNGLIIREIRWFYCTVK